MLRMVPEADRFGHVQESTPNVSESTSGKVF